MWPPAIPPRHSRQPPPLCPELRLWLLSEQVDLESACADLREGEAPDDAGIAKVAGEHIAAYKLPKEIVYVQQIQRSPSGKADYRWAKQTALRELRGEEPG